MGISEWWAVEHTGGCNGKLRGFTLEVNKTMAQIALKRLGHDPACRVVRVRVEVLEVVVE